MREKLIEVMEDTRANAAWHRWGYEEAADYLIANGVVPVVRCNDCKFYDEQDELADIAGWTDGEPYCFCEEMMEYMPRKGFCHKGEGKDNGR